MYIPNAPFVLFQNPGGNITQLLVSEGVSKLPQWARDNGKLRPVALSTSHLRRHNRLGHHLYRSPDPRLGARIQSRGYRGRFSRSMVPIRHVRRLHSGRRLVRDSY